MSLEEKLRGLPKEKQFSIDGKAYLGETVWLHDVVKELGVVADKIRSWIEDSPRAGISMLDDNMEVYVNAKEVLGLLVTSESKQKTVEE